MGKKIVVGSILDCFDSGEHPSKEVASLSPTSEQLQEIFERLELGLPFVYDDSLSELLTFTKNLQDPVHRWFFFKESFSPQLVERILKLYPIPSKYLSILDPFAGAGTTLMVSQSFGIPAIGIELNPFSVFLSSVKVNRHSIDPTEFEKVLDQVLNDMKSGKADLPALSTLHNEKYFPNNHAYELVRLRDSIQKRRTSAIIKDALLLALTATLEDVSCLHRDGRMLRYRLRSIIHPKEALYLHASRILEDLLIKSNNLEPNVRIFQGDARDLSNVLTRHNIKRRFGLIVYSPPYPNNFDYSEVYKIELWLTGLIKSYEQWLNLRKSTFRSHPSCSFPTTDYLKKYCREIYLLIEQLARCTNIDGYAKESAPKVIRGYFDDMFLSLRQQILKLAPGGYIICVVGNAQHGNLHIPADVLIAKIGQSLGLELVEIRVAKLRMSRNQQIRKLRESLVVFRKSK